jgi:hypothetical protein
MTRSFNMQRSMRAAARSKALVRPMSLFPWELGATLAIAGIGLVHAYYKVNSRKNKIEAANSDLWGEDDRIIKKIRAKYENVAKASRRDDKILQLGEIKSYALLLKDENAGRSLIEMASKGIAHLPVSWIKHASWRTCIKNINAAICTIENFIFSRQRKFNESIDKTDKEFDRRMAWVGVGCALPLYFFWC